MASVYALVVAAGRGNRFGGAVPKQYLALGGASVLRRIGPAADAAGIAALTKVKGIGRWSAEMFLMFRLHRPDVLPVDDLGIVNAVKNVYGLRKRPTADRIRKIGEAWRPYRSVASWYLWRSLDNE